MSSTLTCLDRLLCFSSVQQPTQLACGCRYKPYVAAQVAGKPEAEAEVLLREYLAGGNERHQKWELTTPLLHSSDGAVSLMLPGVQASLNTLSLYPLV